MYKIISHNDLDGYAINVLCKYFNIDTSIQNINNKIVDETLMNLFNSKNLNSYEKIFICDVHPSDKVAEYIDKNVPNVILIDHHETCKHLNKYSWANVCTEKNGTLCCATSLFYEYLLSNKIIKYKKPIIDTYVESVRLFDTGDYYRKTYDSKYSPRELSILFYIYNKRYLTKQVNTLWRQKELFTDEDMDLIINIQEKINNQAKYKQKDLYFIEFEGHKTGVFFPEDALAISAIAAKAYENHPDVNLFMFVQMPKTISLRSFNDVNAAKIAEKYGGGGHATAAGFSVDDINTTIKIITNKI